MLIVNDGHLRESRNVAHNYASHNEMARSKYAQISPGLTIPHIYVQNATVPIVLGPCRYARHAAKPRHQESDESRLDSVRHPGVSIISRPEPTSTVPRQIRPLFLGVVCLVSVFLGVGIGYFALQPGSLEKQTHFARQMRHHLNFASADQGYPGHWGVMRPGVGTIAPDKDQQAEIKRLQSLGYVGGSQPLSQDTGTTIHLRGSASRNLRFYLSGHTPGAELIDAEGRIRHRWNFSYDDCLAANQDPTVEFLPDRAGVTSCWRRARLLPDGDILAIFEGHGIIRLDRDSNLKWSYPGACHHDMDLAPDGSIYVLTREARIVPRFHPDKPVLMDFITHLSADGQELDSVDLLAAFANSVYASFLNYAKEAGDIFHTNTLELLDGSLAHKSPVFKAGNFLISVRELGVVAIVDPAQQKVVWALSGMWSAQHQPTLLENGNMLVFDNQGHGGNSKVVEIEPLTQEVVWEFVDSPSTPFYSETCGTSQRLDNGNTLITESDNGRVFEVTASGTVVWEFRNPERSGPDRQYIAAIMEMVALPNAGEPEWLTEKKLSALIGD